MITPPLKNEPVLNEEDHIKWSFWRQSCLQWSETRQHKSKVEKAEKYIDKMSGLESSSYVGWSAGKDSTVVTHLVKVKCGINDVSVMSIKDDLDFPGECQYIDQLSDRWCIEVDVLTPAFSLQDYLQKSAIRHDEEIHKSHASLSKKAFYPLIENYRNRTGRIHSFLGLRGGESSGRDYNASRGGVYQKKNGQYVCQPIKDWDDMDVYAYLFSHNIPIHPVYKCVRLVDECSDIRKSWWVSGSHNSIVTWTTWLRAHWPSLWKKHQEIFPESKSEG
jgi:3'-phosphoadenosine 5'-phosphosulfate sulfotransferase (PAPS reductase)/FAD synthetase